MRAEPLVAPLRAGAVALLFAGQLWLLRPFEDLDDWKPLSGVLRSGGLAVSVLLACSGFVVVSWVLTSELSGPRALRSALFRHLVPLLAVVLLALVVVWFVVLLDSTDPYPVEVTRASFEQVLGFNWNHYVAANPLGVRPDLVGLWYFSVEVQTLPAAAVVAVLLRSRPRVLVVVAFVAVVAVEAGQVVLASEHGWFPLSLWTVTRGDAVVWGAAGAAVVHLVRSRTPEHRVPEVAAYAAQLAGATVVLFVGLVFAMAWAGPMAQFRGLGAGVAAVTTLVLASSALAPGPGTVLRLRTVPWLQDLGNVWLVVVALAGPFLYTLNRNTTTWSADSRLVIGLLLFGMLLYAVAQVAVPALRGPFERWEEAGRLAPPGAGAPRRLITNDAAATRRSPCPG